MRLDHPQGLKDVVPFRLGRQSGNADAATIERMLRHYRAVLETVAGDSGRRLSELPLMSDAERRQLRDWGAGAEGRADGADEGLEEEEEGVL